MGQMLSYFRLLLRRFFVHFDKTTIMKTSDPQISDIVEKQKPYVHAG